MEADPALLQARDEDGYTPLHLATIAGNKAVVKYLISKGADISALDNEKHTVIHWATGESLNSDFVYVKTLGYCRARFELLAEVKTIYGHPLGLVVMSFVNSLLLQRYV